MPRIPCSACTKVLNVPDKAVGKRIRCPGCGHVFGSSDQSVFGS